MANGYGYDGHLGYCEQCQTYERADTRTLKEADPDLLERCAVGEALCERERMSDAYDEGGEG